MVLTIRTLTPLKEKPQAGNPFFPEFQIRPFARTLAVVKISVIVPAFNEEKLIAATLEKIQAAMESFSRRGWESELIVCDNNSTDATGALARAAGARVVFEAVNQIARARNAGAAVATGGWLIFVDADSHPTPELFAAVAGEIQRGRCLAGGSTIRLDERNLLGDLVTRGWNIFSRIRRWAAGSFIFCEREAFRAVGGFNQELFASEELDLSQRLKKLGQARGKKMIILHRHPMLTSARKMRLYSGGEWLAFMRKAVLNPRQTITSREACAPWYDGRR